jgi:hypothetical protein
MSSLGNRLMLCAGDVRREGWLTLDCDAVKGADFLAVIPPLPAPVKAVAWDEIEWIHGVGTLYPWEAAAFLIELREALVFGGRLTLEQPDFRHAIERVEWLFGDRSICDPLIMNRWSYTPDSLADALRKAGYREIRVLPAQFHVAERDFRIEAIA